MPKEEQHGYPPALALQSWLAGRPACSSPCGCSVIKELGTIKELQEDYMASDNQDYGSLSSLILTPTNTQENHL